MLPPPPPASPQCKVRLRWYDWSKTRNEIFVGTVLFPKSTLHSEGNKEIDNKMIWSWRRVSRYILSITSLSEILELVKHKTHLFRNPKYRNLKYWRMKSVVAGPGWAGRTALVFYRFNWNTITFTEAHQPIIPCLNLKICKSVKFLTNWQLLSLSG